MGVEKSLLDDVAPLLDLTTTTSPNHGFRGPENRSSLMSGSAPGKRVGNLGKNGYLNLVKQPRPTQCDANASWEPNAQPAPDWNHCSSLPPRPRPNTKVSITHLSTQRKRLIDQPVAALNLNNLFPTNRVDAQYSIFNI